MERKKALMTLALLGGGIAATPLLLAARGDSQSESSSVADLGKPLHPPGSGPVKVGIVIGPDLVTIDMFGPWAAFRAANLAGEPLFDIYGIANSMNPIDVDGVKIEPKYSFDTAPRSEVIVVPNQRNAPETVAYVKSAAARADVTMSVCTGAFIVGEAGLFDGLKATTHHSAYDAFAAQFPHVTLVRGPKYVEEPSVSSSGGETSGIDLALRVVERYYGSDVARTAAYAMEYHRGARPESANDV